MKHSILMALVVMASAAFAQKPAMITIKAGEDISSMYQHIYRYPAFVAGRIYFVDDSARSVFNYNMLDDRMEFIGEKSDTLVIANEKLVKNVIINRDSFYYYNGGYLLSVGVYGKIRLLAQERLKLADEKNMGSYGMTSSTHSIDSKKTLLSLQTMTLQLNKDLVFTREENFFFVNKGSYMPATRKNILKLLDSKEKAAAETYITTQEIDFKKQSDLQRLFQHLFSAKN